jgi:NADH dehydrogenase [ubiquinone] 1 alpha subcomplex assembly factor 7
VVSDARKAGMTALAAILKARIAASGPISVAEYMTECLLHPVHGYYSTRDPFGAAGDFTTAPEISQMFGELLGLCLAQAWLDQGSPAPFTLAELGPGRGTLMADALRATKAVAGFHAGAEVVMVEASPVLRVLQEMALTREKDHGARWIDAIGSLPEQPLFLVANEFFDALPIHQYQGGPDGWYERLLGLREGQLAFGLSPIRHQAMDPPFVDCHPGTVVEYCPSARAVMDTIRHRLDQHGGAAVIIDYGGWRSRGDTLQALRNHASEDPLAHPGEADLTAHVDFEALCRAESFPHTGLTDQGVFLRRLGIDQRTARLAAGLTGDALESHLAAHRRLTDPAEMGSLFKAIAFHAPGTPPPPGFDPPHA